MKMFGLGNSGNSLGSVNPEARYQDANKKVKLAELALSEAENNLIKAKRELETVYKEWKKFNGYDLQKDYQK